MPEVRTSLTVWVLRRLPIKRDGSLGRRDLPARVGIERLAAAMAVRGFEVVEIFDKDKSQIHKLTSFAAVEGERITYPPSDF